MKRLVTALGVAVLTVGCSLLVDVPVQAHAAPDNCPPACDRIPDAAWIDPSAIPLHTTYSWPTLSALAVTATKPRFQFEELCAKPPPHADPREYAVAAKALVINPPGQWQLQVQVIHWRGDVWLGGQNADATIAAAAWGLRTCQLSAPAVSPSVTIDQPGRLAAVISGSAATPVVAHQYLASHPASGTVVELAMWASSPPLVGWPTVNDQQVLDALITPLCTAYIGSCG
ncbi:ATPase [Mycobacterium sp.]|uniref:ATPase n=1 Tax=Mycobacterium sp. TaxID=1785 RepID=UPI0039C95C37